MCRQAFFLFALSGHLSRCNRLEKELDGREKKTDRMWHVFKPFELVYIVGWHLFSFWPIAFFLVYAKSLSWKNNGQRRENGNMPRWNLVLWIWWWYEPKIDARIARLTMTLVLWRCVSISVCPAVKRNLGSMNGKLISTNFKPEHKEIYRPDGAHTHKFPRFIRVI